MTGVRLVEERIPAPQKLDAAATVMLERMPAVVRALFASGDAAPITIEALDATLKTANLPTEKRIEIKNELSRKGLLASTDRRVNTLARL